jgi:(2Fe-2S) ferredoxin
MDKNKNPELFFRQHVFCCINIRSPGSDRGCCAEKNSQQLQAYMKSRCKELGLDDTRINNSGCLDRCEFGPTMVIYPDGIWYSYQTKEDIDDIINEHIVNGQIVERLQIKK